MRADELLILNYRNFSERVGNLYSQLDKSTAMKELLSKNPVGLINKFLFSEYNVSAGEINQGNRLLFSLLSNPKFLKWSERFEEQIKEELKQIPEKEYDENERVKMLFAKLDRSKLYQQLAQATLEFGDFETIYSIIIKDPDSFRRRDFLDWENILHPPQPPHPVIVVGCDMADVAVEIETFIYAVAAVAVAAVAVVVVVAGALIPANVKETLTREDLQRVTNYINNNLIEVANKFRKEGLLGSIDGLKQGF